MNIHQFIGTYGYLGLIIAVILQTSILPIPWEIAILAATGGGLNLHLVVICSTTGALIGGLLFFLLGRYAGLPAILKYGKYFGIRQQQIIAMEIFSKKYGGYSVFLARLFPFVPYKIFSIVAGLIEIPLIGFVVWTVCGLLPRIYFIALIGHGVHVFFPGL